MAFGWKQAYDYLKRAHEGSRLGHAYLICGPQGSGKQELAQQLAALINAETLAEKKISVDNHPDIHTVSPQSKSRRIVIEQMRALEGRLHRMATLGPMKVGIVNEADRLQPQAANAFLKTLEEPPQNSLLLLLTSSPEGLLDTIISRCIMVQLKGPEKLTLTDAQSAFLKELGQQFQDASDDGSSVARAYRMSQAFARVLAKVRNELEQESEAALAQEKEHYRQTTDSGSDYLKQRENQAKAFNQSQYLRQRSEIASVAIQWWVDVLKHAQGGSNGVMLTDYAKHTRTLAEKLSFHEITRRLTALEELYDHLNYNVQEALAVETACLKAFG